MKMTLATKGRPKKNSKIDDIYQIRTDPLTDWFGLKTLI